jgi:hypothetical protein
MRPKFWPMMNIALWRYFTASSGFANWADAGAARVNTAAATARVATTFIDSSPVVRVAGAKAADYTA